MPAGRIRPKRGGDKKLAGMRNATATAPDVLTVISKNAAEQLVNNVKQGFRDEKDPYGKPWKKPKKRPDGRKMLSGKTSRLKGGWHVVKASKRGFTIAPSVDYAIFHQKGTRFIDIRMMVPDGIRGLPPSWAQDINEVAEEAFELHFGDIGGGGASFITHKIIGLKRRFSVEAILKRALKANE